VDVRTGAVWRSPLPPVSTAPWGSSDMALAVRAVGRPPRPASAVCETAMEWLVGLHELEEQHRSRLWHGALVLGDYLLLSEIQALAGTCQVQRTQLRRIAGRADRLSRGPDGKTGPGHGAAA
jgi:hypothetical protein